MGRLIIYLYRIYYYYYYSYTEIYIYYLYDVTGCFCLGSLSGAENCTAERKQNGECKQGRTRLAEAEESASHKQKGTDRPGSHAPGQAGSFLLTRNRSGGFSGSGYFGPINPRRTRRNGAVMAQTAERGKE